MSGTGKVDFDEALKPKTITSTDVGDDISSWRVSNVGDKSIYKNIW